MLCRDPPVTFGGTQRTGYGPTQAVAAERKPAI